MCRPAEGAAAGVEAENRGRFPDAEKCAQA